jgi:hypothetical protein
MEKGCQFALFSYMAPSRSSSSSTRNGALVLTTRGSDFELHIGQDLSIGYLSHTIVLSLYLQQSFTLLLLTSGAAVALIPSAKAETT